MEVGALDLDEEVAAVVPMHQERRGGFLAIRAPHAMEWRCHAPCGVEAC